MLSSGPHLRRHVVLSSYSFLRSSSSGCAADRYPLALLQPQRACSTAPPPPAASSKRGPEHTKTQQQQQQQQHKPSMYQDVDDPSTVPASTFRTMYPPVKLKARSEQRTGASRSRGTLLLEKEEGEEEGQVASSMVAAPSEGAAASRADAPGDAVAAPQEEDDSRPKDLNEIQRFLEEVQDQKEREHRRHNAQLPYPVHPDVLAPRFRRIRRRTKLLRVEVDAEAYPNEDAPRFSRRDVAIALPAPRPHPWLGPSTPTGPFITHGDGQINMRGGTGEVGFDGDADTAADAYHGTNDVKRLQHLDPHVNLYGRAKATDQRDFGTVRSETDYAKDFLARYAAYHAKHAAEAKATGEGGEEEEEEEQLPREGAVPLFDRLTPEGAQALSEQLRAIASNDTMPTYFRGLQHTSLLQRTLPQRHGTARQDVSIKHSFSLTGRGVFATRAIAKGEIIMLMADAAHSVGVRGETERLEDMMVSILQDTLALLAAGPAAREEYEEALRYLHTWVLNGQPSALLEHWPKAATQRVLDRLGGDGMLLLLELHPIHIARMAAIIDMNAFLVESSFAQRKGMAYFPEAGFFNHSCSPNAEYEIMPEHVFKESDYCLDETLKRERQEEEEAAAEAEAAATAAEEATKKTSSSVAAQPPDGGDVAAAAPPPATLSSTPSYPDLTPAGAPTYLFCCRAGRDIAAGEELLIAYVPPAWTFDQRQHVLHDRYKFWCKCPRCAPVLDSRYARVPKYVIALMVSVLVLQGWLMAARHAAGETAADGEAGGTDSELQRWQQMDPAARAARLRELGLDQDQDIEQYLLQQQKRRRQQQRRDGLLERLARQQQENDLLMGTEQQMRPELREMVLDEERRKMGKL